MNPPLYLASHGCYLCHGSGLRSRDACNCVFRAAFRIALRRSMREPVAGAAGFARQAQYAADILLCAKAMLGTGEMRMFRWHYFEGTEWLEIAARLGRPGDRNIFHQAYRIEARIGAKIVERRLHLIEEYFVGVSQGTADLIPKHRRRLFSGLYSRNQPVDFEFEAMREKHKNRAVQPPLARAAAMAA